MKKTVFDAGGVWASTFTDRGKRGGRAMTRPRLGPGLAAPGVDAGLPRRDGRPAAGGPGVQAAEPGPAAFVKAVADPFAWHALKLTFATALVMVAINAVMGTATAWVLVRYDFPGKAIMNALIDLPFAVPTVVTGLMLVALYGPSSVLGTILGRAGLAIIYQQPGIVLALLFVTYPFVIRTVQPVLLEVDRGEEEAAATLGADAWTIFRRVTLPTPVPVDRHRHRAGLQPGPGRVRQRGDGRRQPPAGDQDRADVRLRRDRERQPAGAMAVSAVLLASSLGILIALNLLQRRRGGGPEGGPARKGRAGVAGPWWPSSWAGSPC